MMDILMSETCWTHKKWNKIASDIKLVFYSSAGTEVLFTYFGPLAIWFYASFSSRTPGLELAPVHVQHVVNEVPQIQASLSVLRDLIVSNFRLYSLLIFIVVFFLSKGLRSPEILKNMLSPMSETTELKPAFTFLVFQWLKCRCMYVLTSCIRRYHFLYGYLKETGTVTILTHIPLGLSEHLHVNTWKISKTTPWQIHPHSFLFISHDSSTRQRRVGDYH